MKALFVGMGGVLSLISCAVAPLTQDATVVQAVQPIQIGVGPGAGNWYPVPGSYMNSSGYRITKFTATPSNSGCEGGLNYSRPDDLGYSARRWKVATIVDGGVLCSDGSWYRGTGGLGGTEPDVLIMRGTVYSRTMR